MKTSSFGVPKFDIRYSVGGIPASAKATSLRKNFGLAGGRASSWQPAAGSQSFPFQLRFPAYGRASNFNFNFNFIFNLLIYQSFQI
ncbi:hypothetical protein [Gelidibacter gilvus]|uniref:Uncharacterized protein n=1 Tax=Gelidibacter gilvus TaxID=59602 RepID=A0A4Q0XDJ2_9FLAO|nr:hypothetical protein [Gelidibacter gilvus]RXJ45420.1 hypothetical protein ESZ48_16515 [Gelidibacter gilvus]